jgi:hypothetical protein
MHLLFEQQDTYLKALAVKFCNRTRWYFYTLLAIVFLLLLYRFKPFIELLAHLLWVAFRQEVFSFS